MDHLARHLLWWMLIVNLHISQTDLDSANFPRTAEWNCPLPEGECSYEVWRVFAAPPGKHALSECPFYERTWRTILPSIVSRVSRGATGLVWAYAPFESDSLVEVLRIIDNLIRSKRRYHLEGVTAMEPGGYHSTWFAFEFDELAMEQLLEDGRIDLEPIWLSFTVSPDALVPSLFAKPWWAMGLNWMLENGCLIGSCSRHFEGCHLMGRRRDVQVAIDSIQAILPGQGAP